MKNAPSVSSALAFAAKSASPRPGRWPDTRAVSGTRGSPGYHGAAVLAARAAQRARPGLITLGTLPEVYVPVAAQLQAVMVDDWAVARRKLTGCTAVLAGPGLAALGTSLGRVARSGDEEPAESPLPRPTREGRGEGRFMGGSTGLEEMVVEAWVHAPVVVVDASALGWLPAGPVNSPAPRVITPHPGEAARLLGTTAAAVQADRPGALRALSRRHGGCVVVLKGYQSLVGSADGPLFVNSSGDADLAQGGSSDVLAGFLAGLLARPALQANLELTVRYAVWQHGAAADVLSIRHRSWAPEELVVTLGEVLPEGDIH